MLKNLPFILLLIIFQGFAQEKPIEIEEERRANRLFLYAVNKNLQDFDLKIVVEGTGFRQPKGKPRSIRIPATSRVNVKNLIIERGKQAQYTYELDVTDSLSRRALRKQFELIKIDPKKAITIYLTENCKTCDTIMGSLNKSPYRYRMHDLKQDTLVRSQLGKAFIGASVPLNELENPVISLDGSLFIHIDSYDKLLARLNEEGEPKPIDPDSN